MEYEVWIYSSYLDKHGSECLFLYDWSHFLILREDVPKVDKKLKSARGVNEKGMIFEQKNCEVGFNQDMRGTYRYLIDIE